MSRYLWVPTVWFLIMASRPLALWLGTGGATIEEGSIVDRWVQLVLLGMALITLAKRRFAWSVAFRENKWLVILLGFMLVSTSWAEAPAISFRRWFTSAIAVIMALSVQTEPLPRAATESLLRRVVYICIPLSYILINYYPEFGKIYVHHQGIEMWTGVAIHKNSLAQLCLITFLLLTWRIVTLKPDNTRLRLGNLALYLDAVVLLIALLIFMGPDHRITYSATTLLATIFGFVVFGIFRWCKRRGKQPASILVIITCAFLMAYGTFTPFLGKLSLVDVSGALGRSSNLTGRGDVWAALLPAVMRQPILGYGCGGFWSTEAREVYDISDSHNGYLEVILENGFVGLIFYAAFALSATRAARRLLGTDYNWAIFCLMFMLSALLHNVGEASLNSFNARLTAIFILLYVSCSSYVRDVPDGNLSYARDSNPLDGA